VVFRRAAPRGLTALLAVAVAALALAGPAGAKPPNPGTNPDRAGRAPVIGRGKPVAIADRYIVAFEKDTPANLERTARENARGRGATVHYRYRHALDGFAATLPPRALEALRNDPNVSYIEADSRVSASDTQSPVTWGLDRIDQRNRPLSKQLHVQRDRLWSHYLHNRHRNPTVAYPVRRPRDQRIRLRGRRLGRRLQRPRHSRGGNGGFDDLRSGEGCSTGCGSGLGLPGLGH
jgi:hypothetical protein